MKCLSATRKYIEALNSHINYSLWEHCENSRKYYSIDISEEYNSRDTVFLEDLTDSYECAKDLLNCFYQNDVTACTAKYILEDILPL